MLISLNELRLKVDPQGERPQSIESSLSQIEAEKRSLIYNVNYTGGTPALLSADEREELENDIAVQVYRLENGLTFNINSVDGLVKTGAGTSVLFFPLVFSLLRSL